MDLDRRWHTLTTEESIDTLDARYEGLHVSEAEARLDQFGFNDIKEERKISKIDI